MILVDINVLLPALRPDLPDHELARSWLKETIANGPTIGLADSTISGLIRISTNRRTFTDPVPIEVVVGFVDDLLESGARTTSAGPRHWEAMRNVLLETRATGDLVSDAHLAVLAIEHGARIATRDRDFARFPGVEWFDPLG